MGSQANKIMSPADAVAVIQDGDTVAISGFVGEVERERLEAQSWLRLPAGGELVAEIGKDGAGVWIKDGPLLHPDVLVIPSAPLEVHYMP